MPILSAGLGSNPQSEIWKTSRTTIPLEFRPRIAQAGIGIHGRRAVETYRLPDLWCMHLYRYHAVVTVDDDRTFPVHPGHASIFPPDVDLEYRFQGRSEHLYVHFRFEDKASEIAPEDSVHLFVPIVQDLGDDFGRIYALMLQAVESVAGGRGGAARADARLWDVLWQLVERVPVGHRGQTAVSDVVQRACALIETGLDTELRSRDLASAAGVSYGYLSLLFRKALGTTVVGYIRQRRMSRAHHLLTQSTLPIKTIAAMSGVPDLQLFNKLVRRTFDMAPSGLRCGAAREVP